MMRQNVDLLFSKHIAGMIDTIHGDKPIAAQAMSLIDQMLVQTLSHIAAQIQSKNVEEVTRDSAAAAVAAVFADEFARHAASEGQRAVTKGNDPKAVGATIEKRAGLTFPTDLIRTTLSNSNPNWKIHLDAVLYITAAIEYLCAEIVEVSGTAAASSSRIEPRHVVDEKNKSPELQKMFPNVALSDYNHRREDAEQ